MWEKQRLTLPVRKLKTKLECVEQKQENKKKREPEWL